MGEMPWQEPLQNRLYAKNSNFLFFLFSVGGRDTWPRVKCAASKGTFGKSRVKSFAILVNKDKSYSSIQRYVYIYYARAYNMSYLYRYNSSSENLSWRIVRNLLTNYKSNKFLVIKLFLIAIILTFYWSEFNYI